MTTPKVDLKVGTSIVQIFDGNTEGLSSFIDSVSLFADIVTTDFAAATADQKAAANQTVLRFVKTRLTGKARAAVGETPADVTQIITKLKERCGVSTSSDVFISKLNAVRQVGELSKFTDEIEKLAFDLERSYIAEAIPVESASKLATKIAVKALCNGIKNTETKTILKAGQFTTLTAAIGKAAENESTEKTVDQKMYHMKTTQNNNRGRGGPRGSYNHRGQHYSRCHHSYRGNNRYYNDRYIPNNNNNNNMRYGTRGGYGGRGGQTRHMFFAQQEQYNENFQQQQSHPQHPQFHGQSQRVQQPQQIQQHQQTHQQNPNVIQNHPLGVRFGQHTQ